MARHGYPDHVYRDAATFDRLLDAYKILVSNDPASDYSRAFRRTFTRDPDRDYGLILIFRVPDEGSGSSRTRVAHLGGLPRGRRRLLQQIVDLCGPFRQDDVMTWDKKHPNSRSVWYRLWLPPIGTVGGHEVLEATETIHDILRAAGVSSDRIAKLLVA